MSRGFVQSVNPATEEVLNEYPFFSETDMSLRLKLSRQAFVNLQQSSISHRCELLLVVAQILRRDLVFLSTLVTKEMGKPIAQSEAEIEKCAKLCEYYSSHGEEFLSEVTIQAHYQKTQVVKRPLGCLLTIMPWNFPFWQALRVAIPAILGGNVVLLKHAPQVTGVSLAIEKIVREVFGEGVLISLVLDNEQTLNLIDSSFVQAVTFTGSSAVGRIIAERAGRALKKCVLELGGSDPYIVAEDADVDFAAKTILQARMINSGQSCIAAKRAIVHKNVFKKFKERILSHASKYQAMDPMDSQCLLGPMAEKRFQLAMQKFVKDSQRLGAQVLCGGEISAIKGYFFPLTILDSVNPRMSVFKEEVFGPVLPLIEVNNMEQAIEVANDSSYGLGAALFTQNVTLAEALAKNRLQAGFVVVNGQVISDARTPFGGVKESGFGRELGPWGLEEFLNIKTIGINQTQT